MYRILLAVLLVALAHQHGCDSDLFLSPPLPPTAFVG